MKLFMVLLGCTPDGRNTEQHDVFFGIAESLRDLVPQFRDFWPGVKLHVDAWTCVEHVDGYAVEVSDNGVAQEGPALFFINLGGYRADKFEEYHEKFLIVADSLADAKARSKTSEFYRVGQALASSDARSHVDDKALATDMIFQDDELFPVQKRIGSRFTVRLRPEPAARPSEIHAGYLALTTLGG